MTDDPRIVIAIQDHVATLSLNRAAKLNAIDQQMIEELDGALGHLERETAVRAVILTGIGRAFSVGGDIHAWSAVSPVEMGMSWSRNGNRVFERLARLRQPVIAALNGYTFGGGLELALCADLRIAAEGIQLALPEATLGVIPGWGGTQRLPALIGPARAKQMIFTGMRVDAATAERWGLVNEIVPADQLLLRAQQLADMMAANAPVAVQFCKQLIDGGTGLATGVALEAMAGSFTMTTADLREGVVAFDQRRKPEFNGE